MIESPMDDGFANGELWPNTVSMDDATSGPLAHVRCAFYDPEAGNTSGRCYVTDGAAPGVGEHLALSLGAIVIPIEITDGPGTEGHFRFRRAAALGTQDSQAVADPLALFAPDWYETAHWLGTQSGGAHEGEVRLYRTTDGRYFRFHVALAQPVDIVSEYPTGQAEELSVEEAKALYAQFDSTLVAEDEAFPR